LGRWDEADSTLTVVGDDLAASLFALAIALAIVFFGLFLVPYVVLVLELVVLPLLLLLKIVFGRPFTVQATSDLGHRRRWPVVGWRASGEAVEQAARAFEQGHVPMLYRA
jgi:membrane protein implicated in regulation of membrane protease activity